MTRTKKDKLKNYYRKLRFKLFKIKLLFIVIFSITITLFLGIVINNWTNNPIWLFNQLNKFSTPLAIINFIIMIIILICNLDFVFNSDILRIKFEKNDYQYLKRYHERLK